MTKLGKGVFLCCIQLAEISISPSITVIKEYTFRACSSLVQITIPSRVTSIGKEAFRCCESLQQINIPSSTSIRDSDISPNVKIIKY